MRLSLRGSPLFDLTFRTKECAVSMRSFFVGVDIGKDELVTVVVDEKGKETGRKSFRNGSAGFRKFKSFLLSIDPESSFFIGMEATGVYYHKFVSFLFKAGDKLVPGVFNPASVSAYAKCRLSRTKTDHTDALLIARYTLELWRDERFCPWEPEKPEVVRLRQLVTRRGQLVDMRTSEQNRLHALEHTEESLPFLLESVTSEIEHLEEKIKEVEKRISEHIDRNPKLREDRDLLESVPGIGETTAAALMAEMGDTSRYKGPAQIVPHAGIAPRERQSGSSIHGKTQICRTGKRELRKILYVPTMAAATRYNPVLQAFYDRLVHAGKPKKVAIIACMNKLIHIIFAILKKRIPFDPSFATSSK